MKKGTKITLIVVGVLLAIVLLVGGMFTSTYNSLIGVRENVDVKMSDIDVQLERRADLIPNLVSTVKGYAKHEQDVIDSITKARGNLLKADNVNDKANANSELSRALSNLLVVVENYPDLKADKQFIQLQDELAGTENRIAIARKEYNDEVKKYNLEIKVFPRNMIAGILGFDKADYFKASDDSKEVPDVKFD